MLVKLPISRPRGSSWVVMPGMCIFTDDTGRPQIRLRGRKGLAFLGYVLSVGDAEVVAAIPNPPCIRAPKSHKSSTREKNPPNEKQG